MAATTPTKITKFDERMTVEAAVHWFTNAQSRLLTFEEGSAADAKSLLRLVRSVLPTLVRSSYYTSGEFAEMNAANASNNAELERLSSQMVAVQKQLSPPELYKLKDEKRRELAALRSRIESSLLGATGPAYRVAERKTLRRQILSRRQEPYIAQIKAVLEHSTLLPSGQKDEVMHFVDGLIPYFKATHVSLNSNTNYKGATRMFQEQIHGFIPSVSGAAHAQRGVEALEANTRAAARGAAAVSGFEELNSLVNDILIHPVSESKHDDVIQLIAAMTPEMMRRLEERMADESIRQAVVGRLKSLPSDLVPIKPGDVGYEQFANLVKRLKHLRTTRRSPGGGNGSARRRRRHRKTMRRARR